MDRINVRAVAAGRWPAILHAIGIPERALSGKHGPCPLCGGKDRFRFDDREGRGTYYCSACGAGDGMQLVMAYTGKSFHEAALQVEGLAGVATVSAIKTERSDDDKRAALNKVWREASRLDRGDQSVQYLAGRGLGLYELPSCLRTHAGLHYQDDEGKGTYPAMLAMVTGSDGKPVSIHRTYLQNGKKAPVRDPKKLMQGLPISGAAIRLTPVSECLGIAEGIETALAAAAWFEMPVWSCVSASGIESFDPPEGVKEVVIFADHDANFAGQKAAYAAAHRLKLKGYEVEVHVPQQKGDWLDEMNRQRELLKAHEGINL